MHSYIQEALDSEDPTAKYLVMPEYLEERYQESLEDYESCGDCGFDHAYEQEQAVKAHAKLNQKEE